MTNQRNKRKCSHALEFDAEVLGGSDQQAKVIPYETIAQATNDFDLRQKVGDGRFGPVFQVH